MTTAAPAAVVPAPPKRAPRPLSSVSAKKLSEGRLVSRAIVAMSGESTRASSVAPGTVATKTRAEYFDANPVARKAMVERVPLRRFGEPGEVAAAVRYLASPEAAYVTGQTLLLDG